MNTYTKIHKSREKQCIIAYITKQVDCILKQNDAFITLPVANVYHTYIYMYIYM